MLIDAVMWPALNDSESLRSTISDSSWLLKRINFCDDIFMPPFLELEINNKIITTNNGTER